MRTRTQFIPRERKIIVFGFGRTAPPPRALLRKLVEDGVLISTNMRQHWWSQSLVLILNEHDNLPAHNLLGRLAYRLSQIPGHRAVRDPWEIGGRPVNIRLAVDMIGDVFRATAAQPARAGCGCDRWAATSCPPSPTFHSQRRLIVRTFWAVLPHASGGFSAEDVEVSGETREEVLNAAMRRAVGSRYVASILMLDGRTVLYTEPGGWTKAADEVLPQ